MIAPQLQGLDNGLDGASTARQLDSQGSSARRRLGVARTRTREREPACGAAARGYRRVGSPQRRSVLWAPTTETLRQSRKYRDAARRPQACPERREARRWTHARGYRERGARGGGSRRDATALGVKGSTVNCALPAYFLALPPATRRAAPGGARTYEHAARARATRHRARDVTTTTRGEPRRPAAVRGPACASD